MTSTDTNPTGTPGAPSPLRTGRGDPTGGNGNGPGFGGRPRRPPGARPPFWRRRPFLLGVGVVLVVGVAVVTDIPLSSTPATRITDATATLKVIAADVADCSAALDDTMTIYQKIAAGTLTKAQRAESPGILAQDAANGCSYTNQNIVDLASLGLPQVSIGKNLSHIAGRALAWADPDGLKIIYDVTTLLQHPHQAKANADLRAQVRQLMVDRNAALADEHQLATELGGRLPSLGMQAIHL